MLKPNSEWEKQICAHYDSLSKTSTFYHTLPKSQFFNLSD
jgi:hypothetical protein